LAYCVYVTDALRGIIGGGCDRYLDWIVPKAKDMRTGEEIDRELSQKFGWGR